MAAATAGALDPTFDDDGMVVTVIGRNDSAMGVAVQPDSEPLGESEHRVDVLT